MYTIIIMAGYIFILARPPPNVKRYLSDICNSDTKWTSVAECGRDLYSKLTSAYKERKLSTTAES